MVEAVYVGGVGSSQPELSKWMLDDGDILRAVKKSMEGYKITIDDEGNVAYERGSGKVYDDKCISFVLRCLSQSLNKNMKLSNYDRSEHKMTAWFMCDDFMINLWLNMKDFGINETDFTYICSELRNYTDQAIRRPLNESDKNFLKSTVTEQTVRQQQDISQTSNRGLLGGIFGGKKDG